VLGFSAARADKNAVAAANKLHGLFCAFDFVSVCKAPIITFLLINAGRTF
jgi:hypothetical protein